MRRAERWLFGAETPRRLVLVQVALAVVIGLRVALGPYRELAGQPAALFRPVWFLRALDAMPGVEAIVALQVVGTVGAVVAVVGRGRSRRAGLVVAWLCLLVLAGLRGSRGKVMHNDALLLLATVPLLVAPLVARSSDRRPSTRYGWPLRTSMVVVAGAYFFAGFHKLVESGPAWVVSDNLSNVLAVAARSGRVAFPWLPEAVAGLPVVPVVVAGLVLALEVTFPLALVWARLRPGYAVGAVALHSATWLLLGLDYWAWAAVTPLVLVDWPAWARGRRRRPRPGRRAPGPERPPVPAGSGAPPAATAVA